MYLGEDLCDTDRTAEQHRGSVSDNEVDGKNLDVLVANEWGGGKAIPIMAPGIVQTGMVWKIE